MRRGPAHLRSGRFETYYTLRGVGPLKPLPGDEDQKFGPGTPALLRAYVAAIDEPRKARTAGTFQSISDAWHKSPAFTRLAPRTKLDYLSAKDRIDEKWGLYPLAAIDDPKIRPRFLDWRDEMGTRSPRQADAVFGVLRIIDPRSSTEPTGPTSYGCQPHQSIPGCSFAGDATGPGAGAVDRTAPERLTASELVEL